jgi:dephospho-CoA kinase
MKKVIILVSGVPAAGKSTFAKWLSSKMQIPLVCFDNIIEKSYKIEALGCDDKEQRNELNMLLSREFFWFFCEEIMKSSSILIVDYFFMNEMKEQIDNLLKKYQYQAVNIHFDALAEILYCRFNERNLNNTKDFRQKEIPFEKFVSLTQTSKEFRYGDYIINIDTTDFEKVSYENILTEVWVKVNDLRTD